MENKKLIHTIVLCSCFGVVTVGAGLVFRGVDKATAIPPTTASENSIQNDFVQLERVNISQTDTISSTINNQSSDLNASNIQISENNTTPVELAEIPESASSTVANISNSDETVLVFSYPSTGEILLPYSVESAIYDPTLDQYRTNNSISFASREGDPVIASEKGTIKEITKDEERGNIVVVEHKDGWTTTYSQLASEMLVAVGDNVEKGQMLALVAQPTKYTVALGEHLQFAIEKNGEAQDPKSVVEDK